MKSMHGMNMLWLSILLCGACKLNNGELSAEGGDQDCVAAASIERVSPLNGLVQRIGLSEGGCRETRVGRVPVLYQYTSANAVYDAADRSNKPLQMRVIDQTLRVSGAGLNDVVLGEIDPRVRSIRFAPGYSLKARKSQSGQPVMVVVRPNHGS